MQLRNLFFKPVNNNNYLPLSPHFLETAQAVNGGVLLCPYCKNFTSDTQCVFCAADLSNYHCEKCGKDISNNLTALSYGICVDCFDDTPTAESSWGIAVEDSDLPF